MNLRLMVVNAEKFLKHGERAKALELLNLAEKYLNKMDPDDKIEIPFICCHEFDKKRGIMYCDNGQDGELFPGTIEERVELCRKCREWCRRKITELKRVLNTPFYY